MKKIHVLFYIPFLLMSALKAQESFPLVKGGQAKVKIVYHNEASDYPIPPARQTKRFEQCLKDFVRVIKKISGAELETVSAADAGKGVAMTIQVGLTPAVKAAGIDKEVAKLKVHSFIVRSDVKKKVLYLVGSTLEGSGHAMYTYLMKELGCRWYMPGSFGEEVPSMSDISVKSLNYKKIPEFELRYIQLSKTTAKNRKEVNEWMRRNRFGGTSPSRGHHFHRLVPEKMFKTHPELFALRNGKRYKHHICMTNPETMKAAEANLVDFFTKRPKATGFPVALADGAQYCECPGCTKACKGKPKEIIDLYLKFTGELFDKIDAHFPGREFQYGTYVYSNLMRAPTRKVPKQLAPYIAPLGYDCFHTIAEPDDYLKMPFINEFHSTTIDKIKNDPRSIPGRKVNKVIYGWADGTDNVYLRDYDPYLTFSQNMPVWRPYQFAIEMPWYKKLGMRGFGPEAARHSWFTSGINFFVRSRLYWNVNEDIRVILKDYCKGMFGAAWEPMYGFITAISRKTIESNAYRHGDEVLTRLYSEAWVRDLDAYLVNAEKMAKTKREKERVYTHRLLQQHMLMYLQVRNAEIQGDFETAVQLGHEYEKFLDYIHSVNSQLVDNRWYGKREFNMHQRIAMYERYLALCDGTHGTLMKRLPRQWYFKYDAEGVGVAQKWFNFDPVKPYVRDKEGKHINAYPAYSDWKMQHTDTSWQTYLKDYDGYNWYRTQTTVPASAKGKRVHMLVTGIFGHMDFFVNGQRVTWKASCADKDKNHVIKEVNHLDLSSAWSWNYDRGFEVDITKYLKPGEVNQFAFRTKDKYHWGGIFKRVLLLYPNNPMGYPAHPNSSTLLSSEVDTAKKISEAKTANRRPTCDCKEI